MHLRWRTRRSTPAVALRPTALCATIFRSDKRIGDTCMPPTQVATSLSRSTVSWLFSFPFLLAFVVSFLLLLSPNAAYPVDVTLAWDASTEENVAGYKIFYRKIGQSYDYNNPGWQGADTTCTIYDLDDNAAYFFVARAFDTSANESGDSNEVYYRPSGDLAPIAEAGPNQAVVAGDTVALDATNSTDLDGSIVSYLWTQTAGISVTLSDVTLAQPTFTAPTVGLTDEALTFQLTVSDDDALTDTNLVTINVSKVNQMPLADAGPSQTVHAGSFVSLDGNNSYDPDGNYTLSYTWEIMVAPQGSTAALSDPRSPGTTFTADLVGDYTIQLVVTDCRGALSAPDQVKISTENSAPIADAAEDQAVTMVNTEVQLNGNQSWDPDGDDITYAWTMTTPTGSAATLSDSTAANPSFIADVHGDYVIQLVVSDRWASSSPDTVELSFHNTAPVAKAGQNQAVAVGDTVGLEARGSHDANNDALTYSWGIVTKPYGSSATLSEPAGADTSFVADMAGTYVASLIVNDGYVNSPASTVSITATSTLDEVIENLHLGIDAINGLDSTDFKWRRMRNILTKKINAVLEGVDQGLYDDALDKLEYDILQKINGCVDIGVPGQKEWITNCPAQGQVYPIIVETIDLLKAMRS